MCYGGEIVVVLLLCYCEFGHLLVVVVFVCYLGRWFALFELVLRHRVCALVHDLCRFQVPVYVCICIYKYSSLCK